LFGQAQIDAQHGVARDAQVLRQRTRCRQPRARGKAAVEDQRVDLLEDLILQTDAGACVDLDR